MRARPRARAGRPPGRGGSAGRPRASRRSRRSARSGRGPQVRPRARRRRRRARATSAATPSTARGTRRRRRPRPRSCRPRAAPSPRSARPPRATSRSACAVCRAPTSSFSRRRHPGASEPPGRAKGDRLSCMRAVAVAQLVEPRVVVPVVAGSSPVRHPRDYPPGTRPRSSADRAAGFEPACGGSTPPGAIVARRARRDHRRRSSARDDRPISAVTWFCGVRGSPRRWGSPSAPSASFSSSSCSGTPPAVASLPRRSGSTTR